jgi:translation initiation factor IF-1
MAKEEGIAVTGSVSEILPGNKCRVTLNELNKSIICYLSGKMRKNKIRVLIGDNVEAVLSPYDLNNGRIVKRL